MSGYGLTYRSTLCNPKIYSLEFVAISIFMNLSKKENSFSLQFVSLCKKNNSAVSLLLLNGCKLSYFIGYKCLNHSQMSVAKLKARFRLQAYLDATIIDYMNQAFSVLWSINQKEGGMYHEYTLKRIYS